MCVRIWRISGFRRAILNWIQLGGAGMRKAKKAGRVKTKGFGFLSFRCRIVFLVFRNDHNRYHHGLIVTWTRGGGWGGGGQEWVSTSYIIPYSRDPVRLLQVHLSFRTHIVFNYTIFLLIIMRRGVWMTSRAASSSFLRPPPPDRLTGLTWLVGLICAETMTANCERATTGSPPSSSTDTIPVVLAASSHPPSPVRQRRVLMAVALGCKWRRIHAKGNMNAKLLQNVLENMGLCSLHSLGELSFFTFTLLPPTRSFPILVPARQSRQDEMGLWTALHIIFIRH